MDNRQFPSMNGMPPVQQSMTGGGPMPNGNTSANNQPLTPGMGSMMNGAESGMNMSGNMPNAGMNGGNATLPNMGGGMTGSGMSGSNMAGGTSPMQGMVSVPNGMPMIKQVQVMPQPKKDIAGLVKTIAIVVLSLIAVTFIGLFIWMTTQYNDVSDDVQAQIDKAVIDAKDEQSAKMEAEFLSREKYPYKTFSGPIDYGELSFEYPKTWSVYVAQDASSGGDYEAYFNPIIVEPINNQTVDSLRVQIVNRAFDDVIEAYKGPLTDPNRPLTVKNVEINGTAANLYTGVLPGTEFNGMMLVFKIRDKTATLRTDSMLFEADFNKLMETITFNE